MRLPDRPPFVLRARVLSPVAAGGHADHVDGIVSVDRDGRIDWVGDFAGWAAAHSADEPTRQPIDLRPHLVLPGMVDLHAHLPQLPNAGLGYGLDLLTWLDRYIFPLERGFDSAEGAESLAAAAFRAFSAA